MEIWCLVQHLVQVFGNWKDGYTFFKIFQKRIIWIKIFFQIIIFHEKTNKLTYCLLKRSKYVLNYRALKFQYIFRTYFQFFRNISKPVIENAKVRRYSKTALKNASKWPMLMAEKKFSLLRKNVEQFFINNFNCKYLLNQAW